MYRNFIFYGDKERHKIFALKLKDEEGKWIISENICAIEKELNQYIKEHFQQPLHDKCPLMMDKYTELCEHGTEKKFTKKFITQCEVSFPFVEFLFSSSSYCFM